MSNDRVGHDPLAWLVEEGAEAAAVGDAPEHAAAPEGPASETAEAVVVLEDMLTVEYAAPLRERLLQAIGDGNALQLDGQAVERVDAAGLQVLAALHKMLQARGGGLSWAGYSPELEATAAAAGLRDAIALP